MNKEELLDRIDHLISQGRKVAGSASGKSYPLWVNHSEHKGFVAASLSFIANVFGNNHPYFECFKNETDSSTLDNANSGVEILTSIKNEVENGWLVSFRKLVSADVFSDFLEMGKYLLDEKYKDAAAVMIGSVLEEHLRQLCKDNGIDVTIRKGENDTPKKADLMNSDLYKSNAYNAITQKQVTAWLDLRNKAAHGKYDQYSRDQVELMYLGVLNFIKSTNE